LEDAAIDSNVPQLFDLKTIRSTSLKRAILILEKDRNWLRLTTLLEKI